MKTVCKIIFFLFSFNFVIAQSDLELLDYPDKIRKHYAEQNFAKGDSLFEILRTKHNRHELPKYLQSKMFLVVERFDLPKKRKVVVVKYFKKAEDFSDKTYEFIVYKKNGKKIKRSIQTEKSLTDGHLICEHTKKGHRNYGGLTDDNIDYAVYKKMILDIIQKKKS